MLDLDRRLRVFDRVDAPDLWHEIERRATLRRPEEQRPPLLSRRGPWARRLVAVGIVALLVALAIVALPLRPESALAIMKEAQHAFADVPPFRAELSRFVSGQSGVFEEFPEHTGEDWVYRHALWYGGSQGWRREILEDTLPFMRGGEGSFVVFDGQLTSEYNAHEDTVYVTTGEDTQFSPLLELSPEPTGGVGKLIQTGAGPGMSFDDYFEERCRVLADDRVAGRVARRLSCEGGYQELWIDAETGLILRHVTPESRQEVESIEYNPVFPPGLFESEPPPGAAKSETEAPPPIGLSVGAPVPTWTGPLLGGGELSLQRLRGKPVAVYLWATWCPPCVGEPLESFEDARRALGGRIHFVTVATRDTRDTVESFVTQGDYAFPVVVDESGEIAGIWNIPGIPVLALLDPDGRLVASYTGPLSGKDLGRVLDALAGRKPIPEVTPRS